MKSAGDYPKIMSNRITRVKPINVGFLSIFLNILTSKLYKVTKSVHKIVIDYRKRTHARFIWSLLL